MQYLINAVVKDGVPAEKVMTYVKPEAKVVWSLYETGVIRQIHYREDMKGVIIIAESENETTLLSLLQSLPMVKDKVLDLDIIGLKPYIGLNALFESAQAAKVKS